MLIRYMRMPEQYYISTVFLRSLRYNTASALYAVFVTVAEKQPLAAKLDKLHILVFSEVAVALYKIKRNIIFMRYCFRFPYPIA